MKIAIVGSREYTNYSEFCEHISNSKFTISHIISGGARGTDSMAERYAKQHNISITIYEANWEKYGKSAGYKRNVTIVEDCDAMIAFPLKTGSKGTQHSIDLCVKSGKPLEIVKI